MLSNYEEQDAWRRIQGMLLLVSVALEWIVKLQWSAKISQLDQP